MAEICHNNVAMKPGVMEIRVNPKGIVSCENRGFADMDEQRPIQMDSVLWMASSGKTITVIGLMMLVEQGKISLDDPVKNYLPYFANLYRKEVQEDGAEKILLPELYDNNEEAIIQNIIERKKVGKTHHIIINAEGVGHSDALAKRIEAATGVETRATIIGHIQRGGSPTAKDRVYASAMGAKAVELLCSGKSNRVVAYRHGEFVDYDIEEALNMKKMPDEFLVSMSKKLSR